MTYEFIATNQCNRRCSFCWVKKGSYVASKNDALKFIEEVKKLETRPTPRKFKISIFGGEPLLNLEVVEAIVNAFKNDQQCQINISTNGDLILQNLPRIQAFARIKWHVTAYDFKTDPRKYLSIAQALLDLVFSYTFTEFDIDDARAFKEFARDYAHVQYKIAFSHCPGSWKSIDAENLWSKVLDIMTSELEDIVDDSYSVPIQSILADHYLSLMIGAIARLHCGQNLIPTTCLSGYQKMSFFNGRFCGKCLRVPEDIEKKLSKLEFVGCKQCDYEKICTKSCIAEVRDSGMVDEKLCAIERACFDAIAMFAENHQCSSVWRDKVLKYYLADAIQENGTNGLESC